MRRKGDRDQSGRGFEAVSLLFLQCLVSQQIQPVEALLSVTCELLEVDFEPWGSIVRIRTRRWRTRFLGWKIFEESETCIESECCSKWSVKLRERDQSSPCVRRLLLSHNCDL